MPLALSVAMLTGTLLLAGHDGRPPRATTGDDVLYCTGCLCDTQQPVMTVPGAWVPSGTMGARTTLRYVPNDPNRRIASCRPPARS